MITAELLVKSRVLTFKRGVEPVLGVEKEGTAR
jgi:hypothetical protein